MEFTYLKQPPNKYTFKMPKLYQWTIEHCKGKVLNLFAGITKLQGVNEIRVDLNKDMFADYYMDAYDFVVMAKNNGWMFDTIVFDPPYNLRKSREKYYGVYIGSLTRIKNEISYIMESGSLFINYGYDTTGMGKTRGFELLHVCIINHSGDHNDTLCTIEKKL